MKIKKNRKRHLCRGIIALLVLTAGVALPRLLPHSFESTALAAPITFVVNTPADSDDGLCSSAPSGCTLREAINAANVNAGPDMINFNIPGSGIKTIHLMSNLPIINSPVTIEGYSQPGASANTLATGDNAVLLIQLDASAASASAVCCTINGLRIENGGNGSIVKGLAISGYNNAGVLLGADDTVVSGNFIGTDSTGVLALGGNDGVSVSSNNNIVGGTSPAARNVISGNSFGVQIGNVTGNQLQNNYIGTRANGTDSIGNAITGVLTLNASNNLIGGTAPGSGNLIAFNGKGIVLGQSGTGITILGNSIHSNEDLGIDFVSDGVTPNDPGDADVGVNNLQNFPVLNAANSTVLNTNVLGTLNSTPATQFRLEFFSSPSCDPSGNGEGKKLVGFTTVVTNGIGNVNFATSFPTASLDGPYITATATDSANNTSEFSKCVPALGTTLVVNSTADTDDGACTAAVGGCTFREAINAANANTILDAINFDIPGTGVHTIAPAQLPNITEPVIIDGYTQPGSIPNTLASGDNAVLLIELNGANVGLSSGLTVKGGKTIVRGLVINHFSNASGIFISDNGDNVITGNFIGTDPSGGSAVGNFVGVDIRNESGNRVGGQTVADRNLISGNSTGIDLLNGSARLNFVQGNYIGTDAAGSSPIANDIGLILANAPLNLIGGSTIAARNVVSGNETGIRISDNANSNRIMGNLIGTNASGSNALANTFAGIEFGPSGAPSENVVGGDLSEANTIAFNGSGVLVHSGIQNSILSNSIYSNAFLGIDLFPTGVTANDDNDADTGPNNLQNFPMLNTITLNGNLVDVHGSLNSTPNTKFTVQLFSNSSCDPSGNGEGEKRIQTLNVTTDFVGDADFIVSLNASEGGQFITATATDPEGNTSEFSMCKQAPLVSSFQFGLATYSVTEDCTEVVVSVSRLGSLTMPATVDYATQSGTASDRSDFNAARGTLKFAPGESAMNFSVLISEDSFTEGTETTILTLSNPMGAGIGSPSTAILEILDDPPEPAVNPVDVAEQFVAQHYHDFLNRQHDVTGLNFWTNEIESCGSNAECRAVKRVNVSAAFFLSIEFQETGGDVIRSQRAAFGKKSDVAASRVTYLEFIRDAREVGNNLIIGNPGWQQQLEDNKQAYALKIVTSAPFITQHPLNQSASEYVDGLFASSGVVPSVSERQDAINAFGSGGSAGRTAAFRSVIESQTLRAAEFRPAFVLMQYFGYLRRNPTDAPDGNDDGYQFWLAKLNAFSGDFAKAEMVKAFILSTEYRSRFGAP